MTGRTAGRVAALGATGLAFVVYVLTMARGVTEIDAGELAGVAATLGVAHPSGYPLFAILGRVWTEAWGGLGLRTITATNLLSAGLAAAAVGLLFRVLRDLGGDKTGRGAGLAGAAAGALGFAFHRTMWSVATVTEVHALQMFLDAALLHALVRSGLWGTRRFKDSAWLLACYLGGLCLTNHLTSALLLPAFLLGTARRPEARRPALLAAGVALGLLGASVYAFLPIRSAQDPFFDWGSPETLRAFVRHVTGAQYRVWMFASGEAFARNAGEFVRETATGFGPLLVLAPVGWMRARRLPGVLSGTVAMFALATLYPLGYDIHDVEQYFLAPFLIAAVWIGLGATEVAERLGARGAGARRLVPVVALLPLLSLATGWRAADRSGERWVESMARCFLETPRPGSVVLSAHWDVLLSPALYLQQVEGVRPDLVLLDQEFFRRTWNLPQVRARHPELLAGLEEAAERHQALLRDFEDGPPYDAAALQASFEAVLGGILENGRRVGGGAYVGQEIESGVGRDRLRIPDGLLLRLEDPGGMAELGPEPPWPELPPGGEPGSHLAAARGYASQMATRSGSLAFRLSEFERGRRDLERALAWDPDNRVARQVLIGLR
jgi:hypothetical protein